MSDAPSAERAEIIGRLVDREKFTDVFHRFGGGYLGRIRGGVSVVLSRELSIADVRNVAHAIARLTDDDLPDRPALVAAALNQLADAAEQRPAEDSDVVILDQDAHRELLRFAADRCRERSPLLESLADALGELWWSRDPRVGHARAALAVLADADLLLPGIDASLRPALTQYAFLPEATV